MDFLNYLIYDLNCYRKEKLVFSLVIFAAVVTQIICLQIGGAVSGFIFGILCALLWLFIVVGVMYLASHFGIAFRKKQTSIQFIMLPVSQTVKFWVRFINQAIVPTLLVILSIAAAVGLAFLVNCFVELEFCNKLQFFNIRFSGVPDEIAEQVRALIRTVFSMMIIGFLSTIASMVCGSLVFGRFAVIKTYICMQIISWVSLPLMYSDLKDNMAVTYRINPSTPQDAMASSLEVLNSIVTSSWYVTEIVCFVGLMVASYILFKRKTITRTGF